MSAQKAMSSLLLCAVVFSSLCCSYATGERQLVLVLDEDFDSFNLSLWQHELTLGGGGNWEYQYYTNNRSSSYVKDGALYINPVLTADEIGEENVRGNGFTLNIWGSTPADLCTSNAFYGCSRTAGAGGNVLNPIKSARLRTVKSFSFVYGKVEVRAKLPRGDWLWPAIWMLPRDNQYGNWPVSGEIDIMESRGNPPSYPPGGYDTFGSTLHWGPSGSENAWNKTHKQMKPGVDLTADFHTYGLIWNETYIGTYFDNESNVVLSVPITESFWEFGGWPYPPWMNPWSGEDDSAPFNRHFYLLINLAVGGTTGYFPDGHDKPWENTSPNAVNGFYNNMTTWYPTWTQPMMVDSVRVWSYQDTMQPTEVNGAPPHAIEVVLYLIIAASTYWQFST